jgi:large exoprotein involved in heme utilization and adhesion
LNVINHTFEGELILSELRILFHENYCIFICDRTWSDTRDITAYRNTSAVTAQIPESGEVLVQATGWRRNAIGKIEIFADKSPTIVQQTLTCAGISR